MNDREQFGHLLLTIGLFGLVMFGVFSVSIANEFNVSFQDGALILFHVILLAVSWIMFYQAFPGLLEALWPLLPALTVASLVSRLEALQPLAEAHQLIDTTLWVMRGPIAFACIVMIGYTVKYWRNI